jgi:2-methylcitrate dehydratase PrpD
VHNVNNPFDSAGGALMNQRDATPITRNLVQSIRSIRSDALPPDVGELARHCLLDWFGVTLAGSSEPLSAILREHVAEEGGAPVATLVGTGGKVTARQAALVNGAASHALDYDDVVMMMSGHPTVPVAPAVLALAEARGLTGADVVAAFVAGFEMESRIGALVMPEHYARGFHATATLGTLGSAAACCHLLNLDAEQWLHAIGIAGTQAAGLKSMFGTMTKPLHAGNAAANGLFAALLASRGFTANPSVLETPQGFAATQSTSWDPEAALRGLGEDFTIRGVLFKFHAACYGTHELIEGILRLRERHGLQTSAVESIHLTVPPGNLTMCNIQEPCTALEGKFSMRFTAALALADGQTGEAAFTDDAVRRADLVALRDRVNVHPSTAGRASGTRVELRLASGEVLAEEVDLTIPETDLDRQWQRLSAKFRGLAAPILGSEGAERLLAAVSAVESARSLQDIIPRATPSTVGAAR